MEYRSVRIVAATRQQFRFLTESSERDSEVIEMRGLGTMR
jgi:hypothetical protein